MSKAAPKFEVGKEIEAYCTKCKILTVHVITKIADGEIKKVFCKICNTTHVYRGKTNEKKSIKASAAKKTKTTGVKRGRKKADWNELVATLEDNRIIDYDLTKDFTDVQAIRHKKFGIGVILSVIDQKKIEVVFQDEKKVLAHNW